MPRRPSAMRQTIFRQSYTGTEIYAYPEMSEYTVLLTTGYKVKKKMSSLDWLLHHIHTYGADTLRKLIIRFVHPTYDRYYYPYQNHNIVLEKFHERFYSVQFYHYYDIKNERVDIPVQQCYYDYCALEQLLFQHPILYYSLYMQLRRPSFPLYQYPCGVYPHDTQIPMDSISYVTVCDSTSHWIKSE